MLLTHKLLEEILGENRDEREQGRKEWKNLPCPLTNKKLARLKPMIPQIRANRHMG